MNIRFITLTSYDIKEDRDDSHDLALELLTCKLSRKILSKPENKATSNCFLEITLLLSSLAPSEKNHAGSLTRTLELCCCEIRPSSTVRGRGRGWRWPTMVRGMVGGGGGIGGISPRPSPWEGRLGRACDASQHTLLLFYFFLFFLISFIYFVFISFSFFYLVFTYIIFTIFN